MGGAYLGRRQLPGPASAKPRMPPFCCSGIISPRSTGLILSSTARTLETCASDGTAVDVNTFLQTSYNLCTAGTAAIVIAITSLLAQPFFPNPTIHTSTSKQIPPCPTLCHRPSHASPILTTPGPKSCFPQSPNFSKTSLTTPSRPSPSLFNPLRLLSLSLHNSSPTAPIVRHKNSLRLLFYHGIQPLELKYPTAIALNAATVVKKPRN